MQNERVYNFLHGRKIEHNSGEIQAKQLRTGYIRADGGWIKPERGLRLKTAIDPTTGRAAEGQLFGYDALARGQQFASIIERDDDFDPALFQQIIDTLCGEQLLGRSRSAEYGRVRITPVDSSRLRPGPAIFEGKTVLWLLADLALADKQGQPTLTPDAGSLGLPDTEIDIVDWDRTFLRTRRYSPWNAARHGYDQERLVITAGSILTLSHSLDPTETARLQAGIGLHREAGLGRLWVNPPLLADKHPAFKTAAMSSARNPDPVRPDDPLISWLEAEANTDWKTRAENEARELAKEYLGKIDAGRRLLGIPKEQNFGPSRSQWGRILSEAKSKTGQELHKALFEGDSAIIKPGGEGWGDETVDDNGQFITLAEWLANELAIGDKSPRAYSHLVRQLAHQVNRLRDEIQKKEAQG